MRVRRALGGLAAIGLGALLLGACSSGSDDARATQSSATSSTALVPGTAKIESFDAPTDVSCAATDANTSFTVSWKVSGAEKTVIQVDAAPVPDTDSFSGTAQASVHCDPLPHDVVIIATDAEGHVTTDRKIVTTSGGAGS
jgi:hypothetical protein